MEKTTEEANLVCNELKEIYKKDLPGFETEEGKKIVTFLNELKGFAFSIFEKTLHIVYENNYIIIADSENVTRYVTIGIDEVSNIVQIVIDLNNKNLPLQYPIVSRRTIVLNKFLNIKSAQQAALRAIFKEQADKINLIPNHDTKSKKDSSLKIIKEDLIQKPKELEAQENIPEDMIALDELEIQEKKTIAKNYFTVTFNGETLSGKVNLKSIYEIDRFIEVLEICKKLFNLG